MTQEPDEHRDDDPAAGAGEGNLVVNVLKILFLIAVLAGFWYGFDRWLSGK